MYLSCCNNLVWDEEDPCLCGVNIGETVRDMLNAGLDNTKISVLQDEKHDDSATGKRLWKGEPCVSWTMMGVLEKSHLGRGQWKVRKIWTQLKIRSVVLRSWSPNFEYVHQWYKMEGLASWALDINFVTWRTKEKSECEGLWQRIERKQILTKRCVTCKTGKVNIFKTRKIHNFDIFVCSRFLVMRMRYSEILDTCKIKCHCD